MMERSMGLLGQFSVRPTAILGIGNEAFAAAIVYPVVMAAWTYLAVFQASPWTHMALPGLVYAIGFTVTILLDYSLKRRWRMLLLAKAAAEGDDPQGRP